MVQRRTVVAGGAALGLLGAAGLSCHLRSPAPRVPRTGGTLVVAPAGEPAMLVSAFDSTMTNCIIGSKILEGLVTYDVDLNPVPALAESWAIARDGKTVRLTLRRGVTWHDGRDFTAEDVAFTLQKVWRELHPFGHAVYDNVETVTTPDPHSLILRLSAPAAYLFAFLNSYGAQVLPRHIYEGTDIRANPANLAPIGTGPFRFDRWERGSHIRLIRNPHYWRAGQPALDEVIYRFIPDAAARTAALQAGEVDLAPGNAIPLLSLHRFADSDRFELNRDEGRFLSTIGLVIINVRHGPLADPRVRRALLHAIDREALIRLVYRGYGKVATGPIPSSVKRYYSDDVAHYPYDPARAAALLDEAGLDPGADGVRLTLRMDFASTDSLRQVQFLRQTLGKVGIRIILRSQDFLGFLRQVFTEQDFDLAVSGLHMLPDPTLGVQRLYWSKNIRKGVPWTNGSGYVNRELDAIMEQAQHEGDDTLRKALIKRWQQIVQTDLPVLNLVEVQWISVNAARLSRPSRQGDGLFDTLGDARFVS